VILEGVKWRIVRCWTRRDIFMVNQELEMNEYFIATVVILQISNLIYHSASVRLRSSHCGNLLTFRVRYPKQTCNSGKRFNYKMNSKYLGG